LFAKRRQVFEVLFLDGRAIKSIQIVQRPNRVPGKQQTLAYMRPDKPRAAGNQKVHAPIIPPKSESSSGKVLDIF
jgi:hypothetical protein